MELGTRAEGVQRGAGGQESHESTTRCHEQNPAVRLALVANERGRLMRAFLVYGRRGRRFRKRVCDCSLMTGKWQRQIAAKTIAIDARRGSGKSGVMVEEKRNWG